LSSRESEVKEKRKTTRVLNGKGNWPIEEENQEGRAHSGCGLPSREAIPTNAVAESREGGERRGECNVATSFNAATRKRKELGGKGHLSASFVDGCWKGEKSG